MVSLTTKGLYAEPYHSLSVGVSTLGRYMGIPFPVGVEPVVTGFGGGAPSTGQLAEKQKFSVTVDKVYLRDVKSKDRELKILIKHITMDDF
ncbi:MAG: hypothetical protein KGD64_08235 [Candidatus Heimdallarchaeota archaeon]|nr:hypothetical protein [Candidatus Heimdallarchaeota archaeon]